MRPLIYLSFACLLSACSSSGNTSAQYRILQSNENAISIRVAMAGYSDAGFGLARDHCSTFGKVAVREGNVVGNGLSAVYTYLCR